MTLRINDTAPDFHAETTHGPLHFHEWIGNGWAILFSHPKDFTPICTTELGYMARIHAEFETRNTRIIGLSVDPIDSHFAWLKDLETVAGTSVPYPLVADPDLEISKRYHMLPAEEPGEAAERTPTDNATVRSVFLIGPDKKIRLILVYPMTTGRNFDEVLRVLDAIQLTETHQVATPVNWRPGERVVIPPTVPDREAAVTYPGGWETITPYLRKVPDPSVETDS